MRRFRRKTALLAVPLTLGGAIFFGFFLWRSGHEHSLFSTQEKVVLKLASSENRLKNPLFSTLTRAGHPYSLSAILATPLAEKDLFHILSPQGRYHDPQNGTFTLRSREGLYDAHKKEARLQGNVTIHDEQGYVLRTEAANINLQTHDVTGDRPLSGKGPMGTLSGQKFQIKNGGEVLVLEKECRLVLYPSSSL